jgi:hypothetical protein
MRSALTAGTIPAAGSRRDVAEFRSWSRRAWWASCETPRQKARALFELALSPWRSTKEMTRVFRAYGPFVARQFGVPQYRQLPGLFGARLRHGLDPIAYYRFELFRPERWKRANRYVQTGDTGRVLRWLVAETPGYPRVFGDKRAFETWCTEHVLPSVPTLMEFEAGQVTRAAAPDGSLPPVDLFSKPSNWQGGQGVERWMYSGGKYVGQDGRARDSAALIAELERMSIDYGRPILLQPLLRNAASDAGLTIGGLCTARITTVQPPQGRPHVLHAVYRMPAGDTVADNFYQGGLAAQIDLSTGRLARAIRKDLRLMPSPADRHPDTGAVIEGHQLPHWPEALSLVLRAHAAVNWAGVPVIGWDVALLDEGPVLLEGNNIPCSTFAQMASGVPLGDTAFVACLNAHLRERFTRARARS